MRLPEETVAESVAPTLRAVLARALSARGLDQRTIAAHLGVTQSAVSKHLAGHTRIEPAIAEDPRVVAATARMADALAAGRLSPFEILAQQMELVRALENRGPVCELHEREVPALRGLGCDLCVRLAASPVKAEETVLANVREAVRLLSASATFAANLPSVGSNVAMSLPEAKDRAQVAAIPGGLFEMKGAVRAPAPPEFGVSRTVATVLLAAHAADPRVRGCVNVAPSPALLDAARREGLAIVRIEAAEERDAAAVERRIRAAGGADLVAHDGAFAIEPVAYVLGADAAESARKLLRLLAA